MINIHIQNSCFYRKRDFKKNIIEQSKLQHAEQVIENRSMYSLIAEWSTHNLCYNLGIKREETRDVDLNWPNKYEWAYKFIGWFCWLVIR